MSNRVWSKRWLLVAAMLVAVVAGTLLSGGMGTRPAVARASAGIYYVDANASDPEPDGLSWTTAFTELQSALAVAVSGDQIWVAEGVYKPDFDPGSGAYTGDLTATFALTDGVQLYGGFSGAMSTLTERSPEVYLTILSGDLEDDDQTDMRHLITDTAYISGTNAYHVVTAVGVDNTALLDGFFVTGGQAFGAALDNVGGGMRVQNANPAIANVTFIGNRANSGGGMANQNDSNPALSHVVFDSNRADVGGGMVNQESSSPILFDVVFTGNRAGAGGGMVNRNDCSAQLTNVVFHNNVADYNGGGIKNTQSSPTFVNVLLSGNYAGSNGGGMENSQSTPHFVNVTFGGNAAAGSGGGMYNGNSSAPAIVNSILWGNLDSTGRDGECTDQERRQHTRHQLHVGAGFWRQCCVELQRGRRWWWQSGRRSSVCRAGEPGDGANF
jgi:hypothetical protein